MSNLEAKVGLTNDALIISCHPLVDHAGKHKKTAQWAVADGGLQTCTECGSIHPNNLIEALKTGQYTQGWLKTNPDASNVCWTKMGHFCAEHLQDMPVAWLRDNSLLIAEHTGVLFYWTGRTNEVFAFKAFGRKMPRPPGKPLSTSIMERVRAEHSRVFTR